MKNLFTLFSFLFSFYFAFGQYCGAPGHNSSAHLRINPNFGDYADRHCFVNDFVYPDSEAYTCASHTPAGSDEPISYAADQLIVRLNEVFLDEVSESYLPQGEFGFGDVDYINDQNGVLKIERLPSENDDLFLITFAHVKAIDQTINAYEEESHPSAVNGVDYPVFTEVYAYRIYYEQDDIQNSLSNKEVLQYENIVLSKEKTANVATESTNIPEGFFKEPNDPQFVNQWYLKDPLSYSLDMPRAWSLLGNFGEAKDITILDSNFFPDHLDFDGRIIELRDYYETEDFPLEYPTRDAIYTHYKSVLSHGMAVAGVASAITNNEVGLSGISESKLHFFDNTAYFPKVCKKDGTEVNGFFSSSNYVIITMYNRLNALLNPNNAYDENSTIKVISESSEIDQYIIDKSRGLKNIYNNDHILKAVAVGNDGNNLDVATNTLESPFYEFSKDKESVMLVGASDQNGKLSKNINNIKQSSYGSGVSVFAPGSNIRIYKDYILQGAPSYDYKSGTSHSAPMVSALAAILFQLLEGTENNKAYDVRKIIETTASKKSFSVNKKNHHTNSNFIEYTDVRDDEIARGIINPHQAILLTKASYLGTNKKFVDRSDGMIKTMDYDQLMFSNNNKYAFGLNGDRMTGYRLDHTNETTDYNSLNHGAIWETKFLLPAPIATEAKEHYAKQLVLNNEDFYLENFKGTKNWETRISLTPVRRLMNTCEDFALLCHIQEDEESIVYSEETAQEHNTQVTNGENDVVSQWFEISGANEAAPTGTPNAFKAGDLFVVRRYKRADGNENSFVVWDNRHGVRNVSNQLRQFFLGRRFLYEEDPSSITLNNPLTDNEHLTSPDGKRRLLHHNGILAIMEFNDNSTPSLTYDDRWQDIKVLANFKNSHSAYRLLIRENGYLEFVGGTEYENGENFQEEQVLKTFGATECPSINFPSYSNLELKWTNDGRFLSYSDGVTPLILINATDKSDKLETGKNLIPFYRTPNPNANEVNSLVSEDESKLSVMDDESINVYQGQNGFFCRDNPLQTYNLAE